MIKHIFAKAIVLTGEVINNAYLTIEDGKFTKISQDKPANEEITPPPKDI